MLYFLFNELLQLMVGGCQSEITKISYFVDRIYFLKFESVTSCARGLG